MNPHDPVEAGEPLTLLREQTSPTRADFLARLRRRLYRRHTTSEAAIYAWELPGIVLIEMAGLFRHIVSVFNSPRRPSR